jgi:phosphatidate cytidylyltransferase
MLTKRFLSAAVIILAFVLITCLGGWVFTLSIAVILTIGAWEFWRIFQQGEYAPNFLILIGGSFLLSISRAIDHDQYTTPCLSVLVMLAAFTAVIDHEKGQQNASISFSITIGGLAYIGLIGSHLISLRFLPDGLYWTLLAIPAVAAGDVSAYFIGNAFGKHKIAPRVSPSKSVEGYLGGVAASSLYGLLFGTFIHPYVSQITLINGIGLGFILGSISPLGDFVESMFKRQFKLKDSGSLIPGHGGVLDRIDTLLIGTLISYLLIRLLID